jgi:low affinity Fe/Cu permease
MKLSIAALTLTTLLTATAGLGVAQADEEQRYEHFKGQPAKNLDQALFNLANFNAKLEDIMAKDELTPNDMATIHQLSYTLENALQRLDEEVDTMQEVLEEVHLASESMDYETVQKQGKVYLESTAKIVKK